MLFTAWVSIWSWERRSWTEVLFAWTCFPIKSLIITDAPKASIIWLGFTSMLAWSAIWNVPILKPEISFQCSKFSLILAISFSAEVRTGQPRDKQLKLLSWALAWVLSDGSHDFQKAVYSTSTGRHFYQSTKWRSPKVIAVQLAMILFISYTISCHDNAAWLKISLRYETKSLTLQ